MNKSVDSCLCCGSRWLNDERLWVMEDSCDMCRIAYGLFTHSVVVVTEKVSEETWSLCEQCVTHEIWENRVWKESRG